MDKELLLEILFNKLADNAPNNCEGCKQLDICPDMYGTGDSPTGYKCEGTWEDCKQIQEFIEEIRKE